MRRRRSRLRTGARQSASGGMVSTQSFVAVVVATADGLRDLYGE